MNRMTIRDMEEGEDSWFPPRGASPSYLSLVQTVTRGRNVFPCRCDEEEGEKCGFRHDDASDANRTASYFLFLSDHRWSSPLPLSSFLLAALSN